jgi:hypothetical protein
LGGTTFYESTHWDLDQIQHEKLGSFWDLRSRHFFPVRFFVGSRWSFSLFLLVDSGVNPTNGKLLIHGIPIGHDVAMMRWCSFLFSAPKILDRFCHLHCVYRSLRWFIQEVLWLTSQLLCFFRWIVSHLAWWNPNCWLGQATTILVASIPTKNGSKSKVFWSIDFFNSPETASSPPLERLEHHPKNSIVCVYIYIHMWCICIYIYYL